MVVTAECQACRRPALPRLRPVRMIPGYDGIYAKAEAPRLYHAPPVGWRAAIQRARQAANRRRSLARHRRQVAAVAGPFHHSSARCPAKVVAL